MKNKITKSLLAFLLLIPFRLPVSILFIHFFQWIIGVTTNDQIPNDILATNVIVTKLVYNIALSAWFVYNIEVFSREKFNRKAIQKDYSDKSVEQIAYWWTIVIGLILVGFIIIDAISVHNIFYYTKP